MLRFTFRAFILALTAALAGAVPASAQITIPHSFTFGSIADESQVNANFTALGNSALNRTGGTITGNITVSAGITIDGADISAYLTGGRVISTNTGATSATIGGGITAGTGSVAIVDTTGKIPALTSTYFTSTTSSDFTHVRPTLTNYRETKATGTISTGTLAVDLANGNHFAVALNANIATFTVASCPAAGNAVSVTFTFTADGTLRTVAWPSGTVWPGGVAPTMTQTNNKRDLMTLYSWDGCSTWFGLVVGQTF